MQPITSSGMSSRVAGVLRRAGFACHVGVGIAAAASQPGSAMIVARMMRESDHMRCILKRVTVWGTQ